MSLFGNKNASGKHNVQRAAGLSMIGAAGLASLPKPMAVRKTKAISRYVSTASKVTKGLTPGQLVASGILAGGAYLSIKPKKKVK